MKARKLQVRGVLHWFIFRDKQKPTVISLESRNGEKIGTLIPERIFTGDLEPRKLILEVDIDPGLEELKKKRLLKHTVRLRDCWD